MRPASLQAVNAVTDSKRARNSVSDLRTFLPPYFKSALLKGYRFSRIFLPHNYPAFPMEHFRTSCKHKIDYSTVRRDLSTGINYSHGYIGALKQALANSSVRACITKFFQLY
jgi:hypothetical protein